MKKFLAYFFSIVVLVGCAGTSALIVSKVAAPEQAQALQTLVGIDALMGNACAAGHGRVAPHICAILTPQSATVLATTANTCLAVDMHAGYAWPNPAVGFGMVQVVCSANCSTLHQLNFYSDNTCTNVLTSIGETSLNRYIFTRVINGNIYYLLDVGLGAGSTLRPFMYYD